MATHALRSDAFAEQATINVTPLIDVLLVLLMILMLTTPLATKRVMLPLGGHDSVAAPPKDLRLSLKSTGELYLDGVAVSRAQLSSVLTAAAAAVEPPLLELQPEAEVRYEDMLSTLVLAQDSGLAAIRVQGVRTAR
jgi:biopolymer transport protein ExbD